MLTNRQNYPKFSDLTSKQRSNFGNGCGVSWMPNWFTSIAFSWFDIADCRYHDFGYIIGGDESRRRYCDYKFLKAMLFDAKKHYWYRRYVYQLLAIIYYLILVISGWLKFRYGSPLTIDEAIIYDRLDKK